MLHAWPIPNFTIRKKKKKQQQQQKHRPLKNPYLSKRGKWDSEDSSSWTWITSRKERLVWHQMLCFRLPHSSASKESTCNTGNTGDVSLISGLGRCSGGENGHPLQYSCLENPMFRKAWKATSMWSQRVGHDWATKQHLTTGSQLIVQQSLVNNTIPGIHL